jgi:hypothetical protein
MAKQPSRQLKELQGTLALQVQTAPEPLVTVDNILQAGGQTFKGEDGSTIRVIETRPDDRGRFVVWLEMAPPRRELIFGGVPARIVFSAGRFGGQPTVVPLTLVEPEQFLLFDAQGKPFPLANQVRPEAGGNGRAWEFTLTYQPGRGVPARLVYVGRRTVSIDVPFTFKDIPLP